MGHPQFKLLLYIWNIEYLNRRGNGVSSIHFQINYTHSLGSSPKALAQRK